MESSRSFSFLLSSSSAQRGGTAEGGPQRGERRGGNAEGGPQRKEDFSTIYRVRRVEVTDLCRAVRAGVYTIAIK